MRVGDIMSANVAYCNWETRLEDVARLMCDNDCGSIPVLDSERRPIGIVTDRDLACRTIALGKNPLAMEVREVMTSPVVTISPETTMDVCCRVMEKNKIRRVVVVDSSGVCCGILAQADLARYAASDDALEVVREVSKSGARHEVGAWAR